MNNNNNNKNNNGIENNNNDKNNQKRAFNDDHCLQINAIAVITIRVLSNAFKEY